jgi:cell wall-associated NlpC family hydrolase
MATGIAALTACLPAGASEQPVYFEDVPLTSWRVNGVGWATEIVGDTLYVGGSFTTATSPDGSVSVPRANLAAFSLTTGELLPAFRADTNGVVRALAFDAGRLFVGGSFTTVNGTARSRLASVSPTTGAVEGTWNSSVNSNVYALSVSGDRLYVGGSFSTIRATARSRLAALVPSTGAVLGFNPNVDGTVIAVAASTSGGPVYVGGSFNNVGGAANRWLVALDESGTVLPRSWGLLGVPSDLTLDDAGGRLGVSETGAGNQGSWHDTASGNSLWRQRCDGDAQAVEVIEGTLFTGFHEGCDGDLTQRVTANDVGDGGRDLDFAPTFDRYWGARALDGTPERLVVAGDFTNISGVAVSGFAIFARRTVAPTPVTLSGAATWRYHDGTSTVPSDWFQPTFDDAGWASGPAQLGYGDGDESTVLASGSLPTPRPITSYYRTTFTAGSVPDTLTLRLLADDGALVRINGVEVLRDNLPAGPIVASTRAAVGRSGAEETAIRTFSLPVDAVVAGVNTMAVEIHQDATSSSDSSFLAALSSTGTVPPPETTTTVPEATTTVPETTTTTTTVPETTTTTTEVPETTTTTTVPNPVLYEDTFTLADGEGWSGWTTSASSGSVTVLGEAGQLALADIANAYARAVLTAVAPRADSEVLLSYRWGTNDPMAYLSVYLRGSGGWANGFRPRNGYGIELVSSTRTAYVRRVQGGTTLNFVSVSGAQQRTTDKQWLRLRVVGSQMSFKIWTDGDPEPAAWRTTIVDGAVTDPGQLFVSSVRSSTNVGEKSVTIDDVELTDGS